MFNLMYYCGLRAWEVSLLKLENYNNHKWEIFIKRLKGSLNNTIRLDEKRIKLLNKYIREYSSDKIYWIKGQYDYLFKSKNWNPINSNSIFFIFKEYAKKTKIDQAKLHPHCLKHSIAVHLAESWIDMKDLQYYLGHKSILNTQVYFQYTTKQLENLYQKLDSKLLA
jgi:site-specific recombinase XerD